ALEIRMQYIFILSQQTEASGVEIEALTFGLHEYTLPRWTSVVRSLPVYRTRFENESRRVIN
ncbi:hypothetical protein OS493_001599, partial [Desmophyllum pertusum]